MKHMCDASIINIALLIVIGCTEVKTARTINRLRNQKQAVLKQDLQQTSAINLQCNKPHAILCSATLSKISNIITRNRRRVTQPPALSARRFAQGRGRFCNQHMPLKQVSSYPTSQLRFMHEGGGFVTNIGVVCQPLPRGELCRF